VNDVSSSTSSSPPIKNGAATAAAPSPPPSNLSALNGFALSPPTLNTFPICPKNPSPLFKPDKIPEPVPFKKPAPFNLAKGPNPPAYAPRPPSKASLPSGDLTIFLIGLVIFLTNLPKKYPCLSSSRLMMPPMLRICLSIFILEIAIVCPFYSLFLL